MISNSSLISFNKIYDVDDNGILDIAESTTLKKLSRTTKITRSIEKRKIEII